MYALSLSRKFPKSAFACASPAGSMAVRLALVAAVAVIALSASRVHAQALVGWGANVWAAPLIPADLGPISKIAAGGFHTVALKQDGTVACWGYDGYGQCTVPAGLGSVTAVAAGASHTVAVKQDGTVACWGYDGYGQCTVPAGLGSVTAVAAGWYHTVALKQDGTVACWGDNISGQCTVPAGLGPVTAVAAGLYHTVALKQDGTVACWGDDFFGECTVPAGLGSVTAVAAGGFHTVALKQDGTVACWGYNVYGQCTVPAGLGPVTAVAAGNDHTVAVKQDGTVACWGDDFYGQCTVPSGLGSVTAVAAGWLHTVALKQDGTVACWGYNDHGQCSVPSGLGPVTAVDAGNDHTVALKQDGTVACWGYNVYGQCTVPAGLGPVTAVAAGGFHTVALKQDGTVACWGYNVYGQCTVPAGLGPVTAVAAGGFHTVALKQDGTVACWGYDGYGQCTVPAGLGPVTAVAAGWLHTVALKQDGTVACWGDNVYGQCSVPAGLGSVTAVAAGLYHTVALKQDGTVACWGYDGYGQCTVPAGLGSVTAVAAGGVHTVALKQDGTVACWGAGTKNTGYFPHNGQSIVPAGLGSVTAVTAGGTFTIAIAAGAPPAISLANSTAATCGLANGAIAVDVTGATSLAWSGPDGFTSTAEDLTNLAAGDYTLTASGPGGTATLTVTVGATADTTAPSITSYTSTATIAASQNCTASVPDFVASVVATDDCTIASITQSPLAGASVGPGVHTIALTVTDTAGNATSVDALFTVTGSPATYYADADHDGFGWLGTTTNACAQPSGYVTNATDCNDTNGSIHPGAVETCFDHIDNNCNGQVDENCVPFTVLLSGSAPSIAPGDTFTVRAMCTAPAADMGGAQLTIHFDATRLRLDAVDPVAPAGLNLEIAEQIDNTAGTLRYALGLGDPSVPLSGAADLCDLTFTVLPGADMCGAAGLVGFGDVGPFTTRFTEAATAAAVVPVLVDLPAVNLDTTAPVLAGVPSADISVPTDAGSTFGAHVALPTVTATDNCDGPVSVSVSGVPSGSIFPIGTTTVTWTATDAAGNTASASIAVTVEPYQLLDATIELKGFGILPMTRTVRVVAGGQPTLHTVNLSETVPLPGSTQTGAVRGTVQGIHVPVSPSLGCVAAKDTLHSVTGVSPSSVSGVRWTSSHTLYQGDSNGDDMVEIVDYGLWLSDFNALHGADVARDARSNFNGDTKVTTADFGYVGVNFFRVGESCTPGAMPPTPRDRITVKDLRRAGLGELAAMDLNRDGWFDLRDMQMAMQAGGAPNPPRPALDTDTARW